MGLIPAQPTKPFAWQDAEYVDLGFYAVNHCCLLHFGTSFRYFPPSVISVPVLFLTLTKLASHFLQACAGSNRQWGIESLPSFNTPGYSSSPFLCGSFSQVVH